MCFERLIIVIIMIIIIEKIHTEMLYCDTVKQKNRLLMTL